MQMHLIGFFDVPNDVTGGANVTARLQVESCINKAQMHACRDSLAARNPLIPVEFGFLLD